MALSPLLPTDPLTPLGSPITSIGEHEVYTEVAGFLLSQKEFQEKCQGSALIWSPDGFIKHGFTLGIKKSLSLSPQNHLILHFPVHTSSCPCQAGCTVLTMDPQVWHCLAAMQTQKAASLLLLATCTAPPTPQAHYTCYICH